MSSGPYTKVQLRLSCRRLLNKDVLSKSDPQVVLFTANPIRGGGWTEYGCTEMLRDTLNPDFAKAIELDYYFEEEQKLRFVVIDIDKPNGRIQDQDLLGTYETTLANILSASGQHIQKPLVHPTNPNGKAGYLRVAAEEVTDSKSVIKMTFHGQKLDKKDFFGKSDPFFQISKAQESGPPVVVFRSEHIRNTLDPTWKPVVVTIADLCNGDLNRELQFDVLDWNKNGSHTLIGGFRARTTDLLAARGKDYLLVNPKKQARKKSYVHSGILHVLQFTMEEQPSLLDYLAGGTQLNLCVAVDFTASNGDPRNPSSLHFVNPNAFNHYQEAIVSVGTILEPYDTDKRFPIYGFGAKLYDGNVSHCWPLNGNYGQPEVVGVSGLLEAYGSALQNVTLWGPTNFSPIINQVATQVRELETEVGPGLNYTILLMITDGAITDMENTIRAIVDAASLPLSIIIVGVGNADFTNMNILDADDVPLRTPEGRTCERDIVQFVPYRTTAGNTAKLAKEVLAEVPHQFTGFMRQHAVKPRLRRQHTWMSVDSSFSRAPTTYGHA
ncbi:KIAA1599 protein-like protein [Fimicolochytrium jonesii]|uniref:KIAA1599 protein-like protein n=1 Tax=Fimicolochytrium jonesii TaxID=1396493 RepID=UPI0022FE2C72|nr:KIAA1599 protein-like protein [Fimicolochytrium jonesii]KAI8827199.1 KIAA1599 protein-like protein [Fimicolochytrium jonesii]